MRDHRIPSAILLLLLLLQGVLIVVRTIDPYHGDETYYIAKAQQFRAHGRFDVASADELAVERGATWGTADWRPPGYPVLLAIVSGGHFEPEVLRARMRILQFLAVAAALLAAYLLAARSATPARRYALAALAGIAPWPFEYAGSLYPDSLTSALAFFAIVVLARAVRTRSPMRLFTGSLLLASTLLLRPEVVVIIPMMLALAWWLAGPTWRLTAVCALGALIPAGLHYAYRIQFTGQPAPPFFSGFHTKSLGAMQWANTWVGNEHELYEDVVYAVADGHPPHFPARTLSDPRERMQLERAAAIVQRDRRNSAEVDGIFESLARQREREHPIRAWLLPRVAHAGQLWVHAGMNDQLLNAISPLPAVIRRAILGLLMLLKLALLALFCALPFLMWRRKQPNDLVYMLFVLLVLLRTLTVAGLHNTMEHRYVLLAWPALLACALSAVTRAWHRSQRAILAP